MKSCLQTFRSNIGNIFLLVLAGCFVISARTLYQNTWRSPNDIIGAGGLPLGVAVLWFIILLGIIVFEFIKTRGIRENESDTLTINDLRTKRALVAVSLTLLYVVVVGKIGFIIASIIYQTVLMMTFGATKKAHIIIAIMISAVSVMFIYLVYIYAFNLPVPGEY